MAREGEGKRRGENPDKGQLSQKSRNHWPRERVGKCKSCSAHGRKPGADFRRREKGDSSFFLCFLLRNEAARLSEGMPGSMWREVL